MLATKYRLAPRPPAKSVGTYTQVDISAPASANAGDVVYVDGIITNLAGAPISILGSMTYNYGGQAYPVTYDGNTSGTPDPGGTVLVPAHFIMPLSNVTIFVQSFYYGSDGTWHFDTQEFTLITVVTQGQWSQLFSTQINIQPTVTAGWNKIASQNVQVAVTQIPGWTKVASQNLQVPLSNTINGWTRLQTKTLNIKEGIQEIPDNMRLVNHVDYPASKTYKGPAEKTTTLPFNVPLPDQLGAWYVGSKVADAFAKSVSDNGRTIIALDIYADTTPTFYTSFVISVTYTNVAASPRRAMFWPVIIAVIVAALAIIGIIIAASILVGKITDFVYGPPGKGSPVTTFLIIGGAILLIGGGLYAYSKSKGSTQPVPVSA